MTASETHPVDADAVLWNVPLAERNGWPLLVLMHGRGSHEGDLFGLGRFMPEGTVVASLRAPLALGDGFEWYLGGPEHRHDDATLLDASVRGVLSWLDSLEFTPNSIGLMGFSQGARMALQLLRHAPDRFRYALELSGTITAGTHPADGVLAQRVPRIPVFWGHGDQDQVVDPVFIEHTREWLREHTAVEEHRYPIGHTISQDELADIAEFVERYS